MLARLPRTSSATNTNGTVLLVEDDPQNLDIFSTYLFNAGYAVDTAEDGEIALRKLRNNNKYAVVITDRIMPHMDGMKLLSAMKQDARLENIPVIMQTAASSPEQVVEGVKAGVYYYLAKPFLEETLTTLVKSIIRDKQQRDFFVERNAMQKQALGTFCYGKFELKTIEEAQNIALLLGGLFPKPETATLGLYELILNAVEHGNLGVGFETKGQLVAASTWESEIARRAALPENAAKKATVVYTHSDSKIHVTITDEGTGFDWRPYLEIEPSRATQGNGRGIAKANLLCFDTITYQNGGNTVHITQNLVA